MPQIKFNLIRSCRLLAVLLLAVGAAASAGVGDQQAKASAGDTVVITMAEFNASKGELKVRATSSDAPNVDLELATFGLMTPKFKNSGFQYYELKIKPIAVPPCSVLVESTGSGTATAPVTGDVDSCTGGEEIPDVTACDSDFDITGSAEFTFPGFWLTVIKVGGISDGSPVVGDGACDGQTVVVVMADNQGTPVAVGMATLPAGDDDSDDGSITVIPTGDGKAGGPKTILGPNVGEVDLNNLEVIITPGVVDINPADLSVSITLP